MVVGDPMKSQGQSRKAWCLGYRDFLWRVLALFMLSPGAVTAAMKNRGAMICTASYDDVTLFKVAWAESPSGVCTITMGAARSGPWGKELATPNLNP